MSRAGAWSSIAYASRFSPSSRAAASRRSFSAASSSTCARTARRAPASSASCAIPRICLSPPRPPPLPLFLSIPLPPHPGPAFSLRPDVPSPSCGTRKTAAAAGKRAFFLFFFPQKKGKTGPSPEKIRRRGPHGGSPCRSSSNNNIRRIMI